MRGQKPTVWRLFWGLGFLVAACAVVLSMFGVITFGIGIGWVLLIILLTAIAIRSLLSLSWFFVFLPIAGIVTVFETQTDCMRLGEMAGEWSIGGIWVVAVLLSVGFSILFRRAWFQGLEGEAEGAAEMAAGVRFGGTTRHFDSQDFKRADLRANFGGVVARFDKAKIKGDKATITVDGSFAGFELYVPKNWKVVNKVRSTLGGVSKKGSPSVSKDSPVVTIKGKLELAGVEIIYV